MAGLSIQGINAAFDALQSEADHLKNLTGAALLTAIADIRNKIVDARIAQLAALQEIDALKAKIMEAEDWQSKSERYSKMRFEPGVTVYVENGAHQTALEHYCPNCYGNRKISPLQGTDRTNSGRYVKICQSCDKELAYGPIKRGYPVPSGGGGGSWMAS